MLPLYPDVRNLFFVVTLFRTIYCVVQSTSHCNDSQAEAIIHPSFLGFVQEDYIKLKMEEPFIYQMGNGLFRNFWKIKILNINSLPVWMRYDDDKLELSGVVKEVGEFYVNISVKARGVWHDCGDKVLLGYIRFVLQNESYHGQNDLCLENPLLDWPINLIVPVKGQAFSLPLCNVFKPHNKKYGYTLYQPYNQPLDTDHWLKIDDRTKYLYGTPMLSVEYPDEVINLVATDSCSNRVNDAMKIQMSDTTEYSYIFYLRLNSIIKDVLLAPSGRHSYIINLVQYLEFWFHEKGSVSLIDVDINNTTVLFTYKQLTCSDEKLYTLFSTMSYNDGTVVNEFLCFMTPFFPIDNIQLVSIHPCNITYKMNGKDRGKKEEPSFVKPVLEHWLEIVLPCLVVIVFIIFCFVCCMVCCKSKNKNKLILKSEKSIYLDYRKPVIFPDETNAVELAMEPRSPVVLSHNFNESTDDRSSLLETQVSERPPPPDYRNKEMDPNPPAYRLPPPYNADHVNW